MDLREFTINSILVSLFLVSFIFLSISFYEANNVENPILKDSSIKSVFQNISTQLNDTQTKTDTEKNAIISETRSSKLDLAFFILTSILDTGIVFMTMNIALLQAVLTLPSEVLGVSPTVIGAVMGIIILTLIAYIWKFYKQGE